MSVEKPTARRPRLLASAAVLAIGMGVAQILMYALNLVAVRVLGPGPYGAFAALTGLILIGNVVAVGLQTTAARRTVTAPESARRDLDHAVLRVAGRAGLAVAGATALASPLIAWLLHLPSLAPVLLVALALLPLTVAGGLLGLKQGREEHAVLAGLYVLVALGRFVGTVAGLMLLASLTGAFLGYTVGCLVAVGLALTTVRRSPRRAAAWPDRLGSEVIHASQALLAVFILTNADVLLARHFLDEQSAGEYAVGALVAKVAFWLPQFVIVVALPKLADPSRRNSAARVAVVVVVCIGALLTLAVAAYGELAVGLLAGGAYAGLAPHAWWFAILGSLLALAQLLLIDRLAQRDARAGIAVWAAVLLQASVVVTVAHGSVQAILAASILSTTLLVAVGLVVAFRGQAEHAPAQLAEQR